MTVTFECSMGEEYCAETRDYPEHTAEDEIQEDFRRWLADVCGAGWYVNEPK
jgi:hypothetical protein